MKYLIPNVAKLNKLFLRSNTGKVTTVAQEGDEIFVDVLVTESFVAIAPDTNSIDTALFIRPFESSCVGGGVLRHDYSHKIAAGVNSLKGHSLEKEKELPATQAFARSSNNTYFYSKIIIYSYVNLLVSKKGFLKRHHSLYFLFVNFL